MNKEMRISMKTVEIAVCDDEQVHIDRIVKYIDAVSYTHLTLPTT